MVRTLKAFHYLIVNITLNYLKKTLQNLFTITTNIKGGFSERRILKRFKENP